MSPRASELKTLNQTSRGEHLTRCANDLTEAHIPGKHTYNVSATCNPDKCLVLLGLQLPTGINLKKLRMQRSLEKTES